MTQEIKQIEKGALEFVQNIYGEEVADVMYLGTYKSISYFGPVFYEWDATRNSFFITYCEDKYDFLMSEKFSLDSDEDLKDYQHRQHIWWDYIGTIQCAYRKGKLKSVASRMKTDGIPVETIIRYTGLSADDISKL